MRSNGSIVHAACTAHRRRKFEAALDNHQRHAKFVLEAYTVLYDIEDQAKDLDVADRLELRRRRRPVWDSLRQYIDTQMTDVSKNEKIGEARGYLRNQWDGLVRYLDDGPCRSITTSANADASGRTRKKKLALQRECAGRLPGC